MRTTELYDSVTHAIIRDLEQGKATWVQPWKAGSSALSPTNHATGHRYSGINVLILYMAWRDNLYPVNSWMTYRQAAERGYQVRYGERSTAILYAGTQVANRGQDDEHTYTFAKQAHVFNVSQIDGLPAAPVAPPPVDTTVQAFIENTGARIEHGGDKAFYVPSQDFIRIPERPAFFDEASYWATLLHELSHWTAHPTRLDRTLGKRFGDDAYAMEELIAELSAAFLCAHLGIKGELRHAGYIKTWIQCLKSDSRAIFSAASMASKASDYLITFSKEATDGKNELNGTYQGARSREGQAA